MSLEDKDLHSIIDILQNIDDLKVVLVLESPYKDELIHKHPLAGKSGQAVTNYIKGRVPSNSLVASFDLPIGCELQRTGFSKLGIMNSSWLPLDKACYPCDSNARNNTINSFNLIRLNPKSKSRRGMLDQRVDIFLKNNFSKRVRHILQANPTVVFVPCGDLADNYLSWCNIPSTNLIDKIPHPSFNHWSGHFSAGLITQLQKL